MALIWRETSSSPFGRACCSAAHQAQPPACLPLGTLTPCHPLLMQLGASGRPAPGFRQHPGICSCTAACPDSSARDCSSVPAQTPKTWYGQQQNCRWRTCRSCSGQATWSGCYWKGVCAWRSNSGCRNIPGIWVGTTAEQRWDRTAL